MRNLRLVRGMISNLKISKGYDYSVFTEDEKFIAGSAAIAAAAAGQFFNSAALANTSQGAEIDMECFSCTLDAMSLTGRFHRVGFANGEVVEFVIEEGSRATPIVHCARNPASRIIWTLPYQTRGHRAQALFNLKWILLASLGCALVPTLFFLYMLPYSEVPQWTFPSLFFGIFLTTASIGVATAWRFYKYSRETTEILEVLGYPNPAATSLPTLHKTAKKDSIQSAPEHFQPWRFRY
jgi:hypothetical protein